MPTRPFSLEVPLRWSDMDALRHVNNVQIVRLLEEARVQGFAQWFDHDPNMSRVPRLLVARTEVEYREQLHYQHHPVTMTMWVSRVAGASFDVAYEIYPGAAGDTPACIAETTLVHFDLEEQRICRLTPQIRDVLKRYQGEPAPMRRRR